MCDLSLVHSLFPDCHKALQTSKSPLLQDMCTIHHNTWARQDCQCFLLFETHSPDSGIGSSGSQNAHVVGPRLKDTPHRALIWRPLPSPPEPETSGRSGRRNLHLGSNLVFAAVASRAKASTRRNVPCASGLGLDPAVLKSTSERSGWERSSEVRPILKITATWSAQPWPFSESGATR